jgi:hypothetical protein
MSTTPDFFDLLRFLGGVTQSASSMLPDTRGQHLSKT